MTTIIGELVVTYSWVGVSWVADPYLAGAELVVTYSWVVDSRVADPISRTGVENAVRKHLSCKLDEWKNIPLVGQKPTAAYAVGRSYGKHEDVLSLVVSTPIPKGRHGLYYTYRVKFGRSFS